MSFTQRLPKTRLTYEDLDAAREIAFRVFCALVLAVVFICVLM